MFFIHNVLEYGDPDETSFWSSGPENLDATLAPFGRAIGSGDRVVEIGCGIGRMTRALAGRAAHVTGIDVSAEMIERARVALADLENVELLVGNGRDLAGVPDAGADVVYSFIVFQHIPDPSITCGYIREIGRVLRPGGWTVFQVSERPEIHRVASWRSERTVAARMRRVLGRRPRGVLDPRWLGSAVDRSDLLGAIAEGGLELDGTVGDGTQFCMVHAHRPGP
jgi:SAM-dependent methyltransferase